MGDRQRHALSLVAPDAEGALAAAVAAVLDASGRCNITSIEGGLALCLAINRLRRATETTP